MTTPNEVLNTPKGPIESLWTIRDQARESSLERCRDCAALTMPSLLPKRDNTEDDTLPTPWQGHGPRCVRNLAGRFAVTMLPTDLPFFKFGVLEYLIENDPVLKQEWPALRQKLRAVEEAVTTFVDTHGWRVPIVTAFEYLIVTGDALLCIDKADRMKVFRKDRYVVKRDSMGQPYDIIIKESKVYETLPKELQEKIEAKIQGQTLDANELHCLPAKSQAVNIFTRVKLHEGAWYQTQEVLGVEWEGGAGGPYPLDACPWLPLRFTELDGEDYGRGLVELTLGDWRSLEAHYISINEISAAMAKIIPLVNPAGMTNIRDLINGGNGVPLPGRPDDVGFVQINKVSDAQYLLNVAMEITQRLSFVFLLNSSVQRKGERVTAEEIRLMAQELEFSFGGTYALLAETLQMPLVKFVLNRLKKDPNFPPIPKTLSPQIITGISALSRNSEAAAFDSMLQRTAALPQVLGIAIDPIKAGAKNADVSGVASYDMLKTPEQLAAEQQQQEQMALANRVAPNVADAMLAQNTTQNTGGNV